MGHLGEIGTVAPQRIWEGITGRPVHGAGVTLALVELEPGIHLPEHAHANEQLGLVIEGSITFTIGGETRTLGPGGVWRIPGETPHFADVGPEGAVVVDVFAPVREDWKALPTVDDRPLRWPTGASAD